MSSGQTTKKRGVHDYCAGRESSRLTVDISQAKCCLDYFLSQCLEMICKPSLKGKGSSVWHHSTRLVSIRHCGFGTISLQFCFVQIKNSSIVQIWGAAANPALPSGQQSEQIYNQCFVKTTQDQGVPRQPSASSASSVSGQGVELLADVVDDLGYKLVEAVELVHEEGVLLVRVCGNVLQLILGGPGDSNGIGDHTWITGRDSRLHTGAHIGLSHQTHTT